MRQASVCRCTREAVLQARLGEQLQPVSATQGCPENGTKRIQCGPQKCMSSCWGRDRVPPWNLAVYVADLITDLSPLLSKVAGPAEDMCKSGGSEPAVGRWQRVERVWTTACSVLNWPVGRGFCSVLKQQPKRGQCLNKACHQRAACWFPTWAQPL